VLLCFAAYVLSFAWVLDWAISSGGAVMRLLIIFAAVLACAACSPVAVKVSASDVANAKSVPVSDARPASEREQKIFSLLITSKEYGVIRIGDGKFTPPPIALLQDAVYKKFGVTGHVPEVVVYHFVVYANDAMALRRGVNSAMCGSGCGLIPALLINWTNNHGVPGQIGVVNEKVFDDLSSDEYQRGIYSHDEDTAGSGGVYVVYIDTAIDGKKIFTRTVVPVVKGSGRDALPAAVQHAIESHLAHYDVLADLPLASVPGASRTASPASPPVNAASVLSTSSTAAAVAGTAPAAQAQAVANQMGCGAVQPNGDSTFVASCGSYSVLISCDGDQCHPMHTIRRPEGSGG
jgi:hypothetical protein